MEIVSVMVVTFHSFFYL